MNKYETEYLMEKFVRPLQPIANLVNKIQKNAGDPKFQNSMRNIIYFLQNHEKSAPLIQNLLSEMSNNKNLSEALNTIPYRQLFKHALNNSKIEDLSILNLVNEYYFSNGLLEYFDKIKIDSKFKKRKNNMEEALKLYELGFFAGSSCLLHSILEGIITDYLLFKQIIIKNNQNGKTRFSQPNLNNNITGLAKKIELAKDINKNFLRLEDYKFDSNQNKKFHNERNDVLHGSNIENFTAERCFITIIWIASILNSIHKEQSIHLKCT